MTFLIVFFVFLGVIALFAGLPLITEWTGNRWGFWPGFIAAAVYSSALLAGFVTLLSKP